MTSLFDADPTAVSRRTMLKWTGSALGASLGAGLLSACGSSSSSSGGSGSGSGGGGGNLLAQLQKSKSITMGIADEAPYSSLSPSGSVTGVAPEVATLVLSKLGITKVKGVVAAYGDLIPGLSAGRWNIVGADLTISSERCGQVMFADPITVDGASVAYLDGTPPTSLKATGAAGTTVGMLQGSFLVASAQQKGISSSKIVQFPDDSSAISAMHAGRCQLVISTTLGLQALLKQQPGKFKLGGRLSDAGVDAASNAFKKGSDTSLFDAYQKQLAKLRKNGTIEKILSKYGFSTPTKYKNLTVKQACALPS